MKGRKKKERKKGWNGWTVGWMYIKKEGRTEEGMDLLMDKISSGERMDGGVNHRKGVRTGRMDED